ncbi:MAG: hypothetical protein GY757_49155 [bacterium]|nr:hypothetical protein [bacterium]
MVLGGDEPHYLVISHSISRDFDLNVFNQYARDEYREFIDVRLHHHATVGKGFKKWYSYGHLPGISVTLAPFFLFKIPHPLLYFLVRSYLGLFGSLLAVLVYMFSLRIWKHRCLSLFIAAVFTLTAPIFFFSIHIFVEVQATLLILSAVYLLLYAGKGSKRRWLIYLAAGFLLGSTIFWGLKYNIFIYLFSAGFFFYLFFMKKERKQALLFILFPVLFQALFFYYLYFAYGNFALMSIYNGIMTEAQKKEYYSKVSAIPFQKRVETLFGIFFDQRDGLILYTPFYFFFFPGLIIAFKKFKKYLPHLLIACAGFGFILFQAFSTVRAGYCPQGRYLAPVVWVFMLFAVIYRNESGNRFFKKIFYYIPVYSVLVVIYQVFNPFTLYQSATHTSLNRPGLMFQQWSNLYSNLPDYLPSFVKVPGNFKYLPNIVFLVLILVLILAALKNSKPKSVPFTQRKRIFNVPLFAPVLFIVLFLFGVLTPAIPSYNPILLVKEGAIPCKIYGESRYPTKKPGWTFELKGEKSHSFTVSTVKPAPYFVFELENKNSKGFEVLVSNFDKPKKRVTLEPGQKRRIAIKNSLYKNFKRNCFYRFTLEFSPGIPGNTPVLVQLYASASGSQSGGLSSSGKKNE